MARLALFAAISTAASPAYGGASLDEPAVQRLVKRVQLQVKTAKLDATIVAEPLEHSEKASKRARSAQAAGDQWHQRLLRYLAGEWAQVAEATVRATLAERAAETAATEARQLRTKLERARALLTEQQARRGRLRAAVKKAERMARSAAREAADEEDKRLSAAERWRRDHAKKGASKVANKKGNKPSSTGGVKR